MKLTGEFSAGEHIKVQGPLEFKTQEEVEAFMGDLSKVALILPKAAAQ